MPEPTALYVPGVNDLDSITMLVKETDGPLNVVLGLGSSSLTGGDLLSTGVKRISLGGSIAFVGAVPDEAEGRAARAGVARVQREQWPAAGSYYEPCRPCCCGFVHYPDRFGASPGLILRTQDDPAEPGRRLMTSSAWNHTIARCPPDWCLEGDFAAGAAGT
jgi:hypothetical protein